MSFRLIKQIFTFAVVIGVAAGSYWVYANEISDAEALAQSVESGQYQTELDRTNSLLSEVAGLQLSVTLFQEVFYDNLSDHSIALVPDPNIGRTNPFLPIGEEPILETDVEAGEVPDINEVDLSLILEPDDSEEENNSIVDDLDSLLDELGEDLLSGEIEL